MRALAAHCPSVAEAAALWGGSGLPALAGRLRPGQPQALREAAAAALDAILRLHKTAAVKEVLAKGMRIRGLLEQYGARPSLPAFARRPLPCEPKTALNLLLLYTAVTPVGHVASLREQGRAGFGSSVSSDLLLDWSIWIGSKCRLSALYVVP